MNKIIDVNMPLPSNTKYRWDECFAKLIMERIVLNNNVIFEVKDKPDLQNKEIGIEVTTAEEKDSLEMDRLYTSIEYGLIKNKEKALKKIESLGGKISNGILIHPGRSRTFNNIYNAFNEKLTLINKETYKIFNNNYIFITDENIIQENECSNIVKELVSFQKDLGYKFDKVYIYIYGDNLYEFDLRKESYRIFHFDSDEIYRISCDARKLVEEKEMEMET